MGSGGCVSGCRWWWLVVVGWVCYGLGVFVLKNIHIQKREKERKKAGGIDEVENNK